MEGIVTLDTVFDGPCQGKPGQEFLSIRVKTAMGAHDEGPEYNSMSSAKLVIVSVFLGMSGFQRVHG